MAISKPQSSEHRVFTMFIGQRIWKTNLKVHLALWRHHGLARLVAGRFVLTAENKELRGPSAHPLGFPLLVTGVAVGRKIELCVKQLLAAKTQSHDAILVIGFKLC